MFFQTIDQFGSRLAIIESGGRFFTYHQLKEVSDRLSKVFNSDRKRLVFSTTLIEEFLCLILSDLLRRVLKTEPHEFLNEVCKL